MDWDSFILIYGHFAVFSIIFNDKNIDLTTIFYIYTISIFLSLFTCLYWLSNIERPYTKRKINDVFQHFPSNMLIFCIITTKIIQMFF